MNASRNASTAQAESQIPPVAVAASGRDISCRSLLVPKDAMLMITSMDLTAGRHVVGLQAPGSDSTVQNEAVQNVDWEAIRVTQIDGHQAVSEIDRSLTVLPPSTRRADRSRRRFESPYFSGGLALSRFVMAVECVQGRSVSVFAEDASESVEATAQAVAALIDNGLRDYVERQIAPIADVDGSGRLTILLTTLSDNVESNSRKTAAPISGCVRGRDFLDATGEFGGDIIYLDVNLPVAEASAIIAHELAHAATFSVQRRCASVALDIPCWLNEAIAHSIERSVEPNSKNLRQRIGDFRRHPNQFPIVIPDDCQAMSLRRGPTRAAGCLFLEATLSRNRDESPLLRELIFASVSVDNPLTKVVGRSMCDLVTTWGAEMVRNTSGLPLVTLDTGERTELELSGTSFLWIAPSLSERYLEVSASRESQVQLTLIRNCRL